MMTAPMAETQIAEPMVKFQDVDIVFGDKPERALPLIDAGKTRDQIKAETDQVVGVAGCSLEVMEGEILVLMGLSGSGKSTLLRAVNGLNKVTRGQTLVHDGSRFINPANCSPGQLRALRTERVAMVFQQFALLPWRTVASNIGYGLEIAGMAKAERQKVVDSQLKLVGLESWADCRISELSGGMQQRVGLARAFATKAPILLMDEPYSALDPLIRANLQDELLQLQKMSGRTIIFVSHDLDEALKLGSRIAIMEAGRIVQLGTPQNIVLRPINDYVKKFVAHMNPLNVLRAREVMRSVPSMATTAEPGPEAPGQNTRIEVGPDMPLRDLIKDCADGTSVISVVGDNHQVIGIIDAAAIMGALIRE